MIITMRILKLVRIDGSLGVILPEDVLLRLQLQAGDPVSMVDMDRGVAIVPCSPEFAEQVGIGRAIMKEWRTVLRDLAK